MAHAVIVWDVAESGSTSISTCIILTTSLVSLFPNLMPVISHCWSISRDAANVLNQTSSPAFSSGSLLLQTLLRPPGVTDPAILTHSLRSLHVNETQGCAPKATAGLARFGKATAVHSPCSDKNSPPDGAPNAQTGSASSSCGSAISSPTARHTKNGASPNAQRVSEIRTASTWRSNSDAEGFVKGNVPDQFGITSDHSKDHSSSTYFRYC